jgi:hypothetical protein
VTDFDKTVTALRRWTKDHDPHVRAAVELIIWHGYWLRREDFTGECVHRSATFAVIDWDKAGGHPWYASSSEVAILGLAVAVGSDRYRLSRMNDEQAGAIVRAFAGALMVGEIGHG